MICQVFRIYFFMYFFCIIDLKNIKKDNTKMKIKKPYLIETENYIQVYYGGIYNHEKLIAQKRNKITKFSRQSQKRLLEKIDTVIDYHPNCIMNFFFGREVDIKNSNLYLLNFFVSMEKYFIHTIKKRPMIFWRKCFKQNIFWYECLLELPVTVNLQSLSYISNMYWKLKVGKQGSVSFFTFKEDVRKNTIKKFCFENSIPSAPDVGRYWGMFYKKYHKFKKISKKTYTAIEIRTKIKDLKVIRTNEIKRFLYGK